MGDFDDPALGSLRTPTRKQNDADERDKSDARGTKSQSGLAAFRAAVEQAERDAAGLSASALKQSFAPPTHVISSVASSLWSSLDAARKQLMKEPAEPAEINPLAARLDSAIETLASLARRERLPMRESKLEDLFDLEDEIRVNLLHMPRASRAESYYDENLIPITHHAGPTDDADNVEHQLQDGGAERKPATRTELVNAIVDVGDEIGDALRDGLSAAASIIKEPERPESPALIEKLAELAVGVLAGEAAAVVGSLVGAVFKVAESKVGEEGLSGTLSEGVIDAFKDAAKDKTQGALRSEPSGETTEQPKAGAEGHGQEEKKPAASKGGYLSAAERRTNVAITSTKHRFGQTRGTLMRVPVDTLKAVAASFTRETKERIKTTYQDLVVSHWVNFGKEAASQGSFVLGKAPARGSKLDQFTPYGVLRIQVFVGADGSPEFQEARLAGATEAVIKSLRSQPETLGSISLHRRVDAMLPGALGASSFELSPEGAMAFGPLNVREDERTAWARFAQHQVGKSVTDGDVYAGMYRLVGWLSTIGCAKIEGA